VIIIAGTVDVDPERREAALEAGRPFVEGARAQTGCLAYAWAPDPTAPGRIVVFERWESEEALAAHFAGPHYLRMRDNVAAHGIRGVDVTKHRVERSEPVYDREGRPRADFFSS
jgi:quinol monooxygenase YgiN